MTRRSGLQVLVQLARAPRRDAQWSPAGERRYDAEFTFATTEILAHVGDAHWGPLAQHAREQLGRVLQNGGAGCAFLLTANGPVPVGTHAGEALGVDGILEAGSWAAGVLKDAALAAGDPYFTAMLHEEGGAAAAWMSDGVCYVALCTDRSDFVCLLARLRRGHDEDAR